MSEISSARPGSFPLFTLFGFHVRLNLSWLLLGLLIAWTLAEGFFPQQYPGLDTGTRWWMGVAGAVGILFSIVFHELSHSLVGRHYGLPMHGITLFLFGGMAEMRHEPRTPRTEFLMAVVGPLASLVLAGVFWLLWQLALRAGGPVPVIGVCYYLAIINVILAVFNMVPAYPLDGGRVLRAGLWAWRGDLRRATYIASRLGRIFGLALIALGVLVFIAGGIIGGIWYVLIGMFLRGAAGASYLQLLLRRFLEDRTVGELMNPTPPSVPPSVTLREFVEDWVYRHGQRLFPVTEGQRLVGCISLARVKSVPEQEWNDKRVAEIMSDCAADTTVRPDAPAGDMLDALLGGTGTGQLLVTDENNALKGTVSLDYLRNLMAIRLELENAA